jgi:hypothetical protein
MHKQGSQPAKQGSQPARDPDSLNDRDTWKAPSTPSAMRASNGSQCIQPPSDPAPRSQNLRAGQGLPIRLRPTATDTPKFPDTEEVTGSNPVRPTNPDLAF